MLGQTTGPHMLGLKRLHDFLEVMPAKLRLDYEYLYYDLYNNFKIVEQKIKKQLVHPVGGQNLAFMTAPSSSSINDANTAYSQVSAASPSVNTDLEQNHEDDLEAMDLKWQLSLLCVESETDTLPGSAEHQEARKISSEIKTTPKIRKQEDLQEMWLLMV
ncbi:hypothetical protein Tco_1079971 [Tanacetum coccineum]|uniref:Uncharacterized protein n=1 Tax=Tanacetum coccineum TaxID=301880 RepID=A0ABQ5HTD9_9ASTR